MSRISCATLAMLGLLVTSSVAGQRTEREDRAQSQVVATVAGLQRDLRDARKLLADVDDLKLRERLELLLSRAALKADDLEESFAGATRGQAKSPISEKDFAKLVENIKDEAFDDDKVEFIETFLKGRPLNCDQATTLLKTLSFDDGRIEAAVLLYPGLVDRENFFEVLKIFPFEASRKKVMEAVRKRD
ncbi:MAG: DUF4476 domain-containing protein [Planctomycetes bacterium]|nr:DUF4476 domain-containing protein [Planctomycetota bacterium]